MIKLIDVKPEVRENLLQGMQRVALTFYQEMRKLGIGFQEFFDMWVEAGGDVYERGHKPSDDDSELRDSSAS